MGFVLISCGFPGHWVSLVQRETIILGSPAGIAMSPTQRTEPVRWAPQGEARGLFLLWVSLGVFTAVLENCQISERVGLPSHTQPTNCFQLYCWKVDHNTTCEKREVFMLKCKMLLYDLMAALI